MEFPYVSAALAVFTIILQQILMLSVGFHRLKAKVGVGIGQDQDLERKVRRHGNLAENGALLLVVLALTELSGAPGAVVRGFAVAFALARLSHALAFTHHDAAFDPNGNRFFVGLRVIGAIGTAWGGIALGGYLAFRLFAA